MTWQKLMQRYVTNTNNDTCRFTFCYCRLHVRNCPPFITVVHMWGTVRLLLLSSACEELSALQKYGARSFCSGCSQKCFSSRGTGFPSQGFPTMPDVVKQFKITQENEVRIYPYLYVSLIVFFLRNYLRFGRCTCLGGVNILACENLLQLWDIFCSHELFCN